jgi:hypothetical protein
MGVGKWRTLCAQEEAPSSDGAILDGTLCNAVREIMACGWFTNRFSYSIDIGYVVQPQLGHLKHAHVCQYFAKSIMILNQMVLLC